MGPQKNEVTMNPDEITFERLQVLLGNKSVLEEFLQELLGRPITLAGNPKLALPWMIDHFPEVYGKDTERVEYAVHIGSAAWMGAGNRRASKSVCDRKYEFSLFGREIMLPADASTFVNLLMNLLAAEEEQTVPASKELHRILIAPGLVGRHDAYYTTGPHTAGEGRRCVHYHFLFAGEGDTQTAPKRILPLLECLSGRGSNDDLASPLIAAIMRCEVRWTWLDRLRWLKKSVYAKELENVGGRYLWVDEAKKYAAMEADKFSDIYIQEHLRFINSFRCSSENDFWSLLPAGVLAEKLEIPPGMVEGLKSGRSFSLEDFWALYCDMNYRTMEMPESGGKR